jgi:RimJ/RimL family protein N-acetyltransferase
MSRYILGDLFTGKLVRLAAMAEDHYKAEAQWSHDAEYARLLYMRPSVPQAPNPPGGNRHHHNNFDFSIRTLEGDKPIGFCSLFRMQMVHGNTLMAIGIGNSDYRGRGYGTDAIHLLLGYAFRELDLHRVSLNVFSNNTRAIHVYEKLGFVHEGAQREALYRDDARHDMVYMGILRRDWEAQQEKRQA